MSAARAKGREASGARVAAEGRSQFLVTAFIASGLLFMLLPGTFLGVWNLIRISQEHTAGSIPAAWLQAHGQAEVFGWIGSFIMGIGFYSLTKNRSGAAFPLRAGWAAWSLWTLGNAARWLGGVTGWHWRVLLPLAGAAELVAFCVFFSSVRRHRPAKTGQRANAWTVVVIAATIAFLIALITNAAALTKLSLFGSSPALPHVFDQKLVVLAVWGVLTPAIWGFNARWLPLFAGLREPAGLQLLIGYAVSVAGVGAVFLDRLAVSAVLLLIAGLLVIDALHVWERAVHPVNLLHVHASFPFFIRLSYVWLVVSSVLNILAVQFDRAGGIWGASRHALTVGFVAGMVFAIGQRILPEFSGRRVLWSTKLMFASLLLLHVGCALRVTMEAIAYEGYWNPAWKVLPYSAVTEIAGVALFALNLFGTLILPAAAEARWNVRTGTGPYNQGRR